MNTDNKALVLLVLFIVLVVMIYLFQRVWNWVVPEVFMGVGTITYTQAIAILFLASMLFTPVVICNKCSE